MKIKRLPEDFQVEELAAVQPGGGPFALYLLHKRSLGTIEAVAAVARRLRVPRAACSFGGLKDRHAVTRQYLTIERGPRRGLEQTNLRLEYLGQVAQPFTAEQIAGNRFTITVRGLTPEQADRAAEAVEAAARDGVPNYFDRQRFGSLGVSGEFVAQPWCRGDYERALWLAVADPTPHDRPAVREEKQRLREHWGDWEACLAWIRRPAVREIVEHLRRRPGDFRGALGKWDVDLRRLYLAALQSRIWNRMLALWLGEQCPPEDLVELVEQGQSFVFFRRLGAARQAAVLQAALPLPSARLHLEPGPMRDLVERAAGEWGLTLRQLRVKYPRDSFFAKGERAAAVLPADLRVAAAADAGDPLRRQVTLQFRLPRGAYATMLLKRLFELPAV